MDVNEFISDRMAGAAPYLLPSVRQLAVLSAHGDEMIAAGTVVLVWYRGSRYLLSAAHVLELYPERPYLVGTATAWVPINGAFRVLPMPKGGRANDPFDIAFRKVDADFAQSLDGCEFLTADQIATHDVLTFGSPFRSKYLVIGFPRNKLGFSRASRATFPKNLFFVGALSPKADYARTRFAPESHIVTEFDRKQVFVEGALQRAPMVEGLSGGGMFRFPGIERVGSASPPTLAAITIEHDPRHRLMIGTRIDVFFSAIDADKGAES